VIAHPDDESMFMMPTLFYLVKICEIHILCLTNGDFNGLGKIREKEMQKVSEKLGIKSLTIIDSNKF